MKRLVRLRGMALAGCIVATVTVATSGEAQMPPIRIGEINSYSGIAAGFTQPYRQAVEMAVDEVNSQGGLLGRRVDVVFRDDKGNPADAIKYA
jgi:branched-chain amino acid transport system substrate-binding protein